MPPRSQREGQGESLWHGAISRWVPARRPLFSWLQEGKLPLHWVAASYNTSLEVVKLLLKDHPGTAKEEDKVRCCVMARSTARCLRGMLSHGAAANNRAGGEGTVPNSS